VNEVLQCITLPLFLYFSRITVWLLMLITFRCAEPAALGTLGLVKARLGFYHLTCTYLVFNQCTVSCDCVLNHSFPPSFIFSAETVYNRTKFIGKTTIKTCLTRHDFLKNYSPLGLVSWSKILPKFVSLFSYTEKI